jgi:hypothetical protein
MFEDLKKGRLVKTLVEKRAVGDKASIRVIKPNSVHGVDQCGICKKNEINLINAEPGTAAICDDCRKKIIEGKI